MSTSTENSSGISRRSVIKAAAWSAPVIAVAVATPLASASVSVDSPTALVTGTLTATGTYATHRTATYSGGALTYNSNGVVGLNSGNITLTFSNGNLPGWTLTTTDLVTAYVAAGWAFVSQSPALTTFEHAPIANGQVVTMPKVVWSAPVGSTKPLIVIGIDSDSDDVSGQGLDLT